MNRLGRSLIWTLWLTLPAVAVLGDDAPRLVIDPGGHQAMIQDVMFTRDGRHLVSAGTDKVVRVWEVSTGERVRTIRGELGAGNPGKIYAAALSPDDRYLAVGGWLAGELKDTRAVRLHDFATGEVVGLLRGHIDVIDGLAFSADGRLLASSSFDETVRVWDVATRKVRHVLEGHTERIYAVAFSPDSSRLASGSHDHTLRLWDVEPGTLVRELEGHEAEVRSAAFSPDGRYLASGSDDRTVRLWDAKSGAAIRELGKQGTTVDSLSFSPDSRRLLTGSGSGGSYVNTVFAVPSGELVTRFREHDNIVLATAISPDGELAATGGGTDKEIYLWTLADGKVVRKLEGQGRTVWSVGFSSDGQSVAFGNSLSYKGLNQRGPLEQTVQIAGAVDVLTSEASPDLSTFQRAVESVEGFELKTKSGATGRDTFLQIVKGGEVLHEIERDSTSGFRHKCFTFSPDGRTVASGGGNGFLTLYDRATGKKLRDLVGHTGDVWSVAPSPDGRTLVSGSHDQTVRLWDVASGRNLLTVFAAADGEWVAWTPEGYTTSSPNGGRYIGWHVNKGVDRQAEYYPASQFRGTYYRPGVVAESLKTRDIEQALKNANARRRPQAPSPPEVTDIRQILPPRIFLRRPQVGAFVEADVLKVEGLVVTDNLPVTSLRVLLNGSPIFDTGPARGAAPSERPLELEVDLRSSSFVLEGENVLTVTAAHDAASAAPLERRFYYRRPAARPEPRPSRPNLYVVAVGIAEYDAESLRLSYPDDDARAVAAALESQEGRLFAQVHTRLLPEAGRPAGRTEILEAVSWLSREGTQKDVRVLFLAGHGDRNANDEYYFFSQTHRPGSSFEIHNVRWKALLDELTSVPSKAVLMVDTCHSGAVVGESAYRQGRVDFTRVLKELDSDYVGLVTFAASTGREVSEERREWGHGAFTKALLEGFEGRADGNGDGVIETLELGSWVVGRVKELTGGRQHALYQPSAGMPSFPFFALE